jgi:hypothetical protein
MLFPTQLAPIVVDAGRHTGVIIAASVALLVAGAFLSLKAYGRE